MTHKNFSFWFCTLLSGIVIGIASQRIPGAKALPDVGNPHVSSLYGKEKHRTSTTYHSFNYRN